MVVNPESARHDDDRCSGARTSYWALWTLLGDAGVHMVGTDLAQLGALGAILVACFFDTLDVR